ncbi:MAG: squalene/phytoene synthase family protein, partial [Synechococcaceae cyanobacterium]
PQAEALPAVTLLSRLDAWEERTRGLFEGRTSDDLDRVMVDTIERFPQPQQAYLDMIEGQRMDVNKHRYASFSELELYCYRVAGTVGLMSQAVMGLDPAYTSAPWSERPDTSEAAVALGIANQLTNILRDVGEDRERGRIYLPQDEIVGFGYSETELLNGVVNDNWRALMRFQLQRAREWFARSEAGVRWLSPDARWPVWASLRLYRGILDVIEQLDYDVFNHRAFVPTAGKFLDLPRSFVIAQAR